MRYTENYPVVRYHEYEMSADKTRLIGTEVNIVAMWDDRGKVWKCSDGVERSDEFFRSMGEKKNAWYAPQVAASAYLNAESKLKGERKTTRKLRAERGRVIHAWIALATSIRRRPEVLAKVEAELWQQYPKQRLMPPGDYWHDKWHFHEIITWSDHRAEQMDHAEQQRQMEIQQRSAKYWAENRRKTDAFNRHTAKEVLPALKSIPDPNEEVQKLIKEQEWTLERTEYLEKRDE